MTGRLACILHRELFSSRVITEGHTISSEYKDFRDLEDECRNILIEIKNLQHPFEDIIAQHMEKGNLEKIARSFPSIFSFKQSTTLYLLNLANSIINSCSLSKSFLKLSDSQLSDAMKSIAANAREIMLNYISLCGVNQSMKVESFEELGPLPEFGPLIDEYMLFLRSYKKSCMEKFESINKNSHVCFFCSSHPAATYLMPCGHTFLCPSCLAKSNLKKEEFHCFVCGKPVESIEALSFRCNNDT